MTTFFLLAALLVVGILALLLPPLLRRGVHQAAASSSELSLRVLRDQLTELEQDKAIGDLDDSALARERQELERRALEDGAGKPVAASAAADRRRPWLAALVALAVPLTAAGLYWQLGSPAALSGNPTRDGHALGPQQIEAMVQRLAERLQENPQNGDGWLMLGRSYTMLRRYGEAAAAYGRAASLLPPNADMLADYADTLAMAQGRRLAGEPEKLVARALQVDPNHVKALALSGSAAFERQDYGRAIAEWQRILTLVPEDSGIAQGMRNSIGEAQARLGGPGPVAAAAAPVAAAAPGQTVAGIVSLDSLAQEQNGVTPGDTVFVFARAVDGSRVPLAMLKKRVADLPARFVLDDSMAMAPGARLSAAKQVIVGARVSKSGDALPKPGDLEGFSEAVTVGSQDVRVTIAKTVK